MPRRKNPTRRDFGRLDPLPSGRWRARYLGPDGALRPAPRTFATKTEAAEWLDATRTDIGRGEWRAPERSEVTLARYLEAYLASRTDLAPRTLALYRTVAARWVLATVGQGRRATTLGVLPLRALSTTVVREWHALALADARAAVADQLAAARTGRTHPARAWALEQGMTVPATGRLGAAVLDAWRAAGSPVPPPRAVGRDAGRTQVAQAYRLLRSVLAEAVREGILDTNPCQVRNGGTVAHPERLPLTPGEVQRLAAEVPARYTAAVLLAAWSGLRPGEVFALRRSDLDLGRAVVTVARTLVEVPGEPVTFGPPKTRGSRRTVALPGVVVEALAAHLEAHTGPGGDALVFTTAGGRPLGRAARSAVLRGARARVGRPDVSWHHLRHTGATLAAQSGATLAESMARLGHTTPRAAMIYQHAADQRDRLLADALDRAARAADTGTVVPLRRRGA